MNEEDKKIILIIGASGSGKTTLGRELERFGVLPLVSFTTRKQRPSEWYGVDYYFTDDKHVKSEIENDNVVESSEYDGNTYGLYRSEVESKISLSNTYFVCDANGAKQIMDIYPKQAVALWLNVSVKTMIDRMTERGDTGASILKRVYHASANGELNPPKVTHTRIDADILPAWLLSHSVMANLSM